MQLTSVLLPEPFGPINPRDRKSTRLNSSHTEIYTLSLHDALPIYDMTVEGHGAGLVPQSAANAIDQRAFARTVRADQPERSEEHTSELQSHRDLHSFPTRRSSDL